MKIFFRRIHLYLGLAAGLIIMSCCLTGAILVFQKELEQTFNKERYFAEKGERKLSLDTLVAGVKKAYPQAKVNSVKVYASDERTVEINVNIADKKSNTTLQNKAPKKVEQGTRQRAPSLTAFVNPYTGKIVELYNSREGFFYNVMALHRWLLGSNNGPGKIITGLTLSQHPIKKLFFPFKMVTHF